MREGWLKLCERLECTRAQSQPTTPEKVFDELCARYAEPHRAYHNLDHVTHCLDEFALLCEVCEHAECVEAAIWFHDAVYDTRASDNEARSAELARRLLNALGANAERQDRVAALILATTHRAPPAPGDEAVLVDVDLAILGQSEDVFDAYECAIRAEYAWVPDDAFAEGRSGILRGLLTRPQVYTTALFQQRYQQRARANLLRSIARLETGLPNR